MGRKQDDENSARWVLAFDAACATCRELSAAVARDGGGRLEVLPLADEDVVRWRARALGPDAPWQPTLIRVTGRATEGGEQVRAWTRGAAMALRLMARLGPRSVVRVLGEIGRLRSASDAKARHSAAAGTGPGLGRAAFLRLMAGAGVAAGLVLLGRTPAFAVPESAAARWAKGNRAQLPQTYEGLAAYRMDYRRAIFGELAPEVRSRLWVEHLDRRRATHDSLTAEQRSVLDRATALAKDPATFAMDDRQRSHALSDAQQLGEAAVAAFGQDEAEAMLATLGPTVSETSGRNLIAPDRPPPVMPACECSGHFVFCRCGFCHSCQHPQYALCAVTASGCGLLWQFKCDGRCNRGVGCRSCR